MREYVTESTLSAKTQLWLKQIQKFNRQQFTLNPERAALLVIDMQNFFLDPAQHACLGAGRAIIPTVARVIRSFRDAHRPVIFTRHMHREDGTDAGIMKWWWGDMCIEGTPESLIYSEIAPLRSEKVIAKCRYSAFYDTDLETVLSENKIEDLMIVGVMTNLCCESTARDAFFRNYRVLLPADGTATLCEEMHLASLLNAAYGFARVGAADELIGPLGGHSS